MAERKFLAITVRGVKGAFAPSCGGAPFSLALFRGGGHGKRGDGVYSLGKVAE